MEIIDKIANLSQVREIFMGHAKQIVGILETKKVNMKNMTKSIKHSSWLSSCRCNDGLGNKLCSTCAQIEIVVAEDKLYTDFFAQTHYPLNSFCTGGDLKGVIREKIEEKNLNYYPCSNLHIQVTKGKPKILIPLNPPGEIAEQLHKAMTDYNKVLNTSQAADKIKKAQKRINDIIKKEASKIVKSCID